MTQQEAIETIARAVRLGLSGAEFLARLGPERVAAACNGIGPEWLPERYRAKLDKWLAKFKTSADVHDCRFAFDNDGSDAKFRAANDELERNNVIIADSRHAWWNPMRYWERSTGRLMADVCREYGWSAWRDAYIDSLSGTSGSSGTSGFSGIRRLE